MTPAARCGLKDDDHRLEEAAPMSTTDDATTARDPRMRALDVLIGDWAISGQADGETSYEWMEGGCFLLQRGRLTRAGATHTFLEVIGFGAMEPEADITSRVYTTAGDTLDYTCEGDEETVTIWGGAKGSPAAYRASWEQDGDVLRGAWKWPGGG